MQPQAKIRFYSPYVALFATIPASMTPIWLGLQHASSLMRAILYVVLAFLLGAMGYVLYHMAKFPPYLTLTADRLSLGSRDFLTSDLERVEFKQKTRYLVIRRRGKGQIAYGLYRGEDVQQLILLMEQWSEETRVPFELI